MGSIPVQGHGEAGGQRNRRGLRVGVEAEGVPQVDGGAMSPNSCEPASIASRTAEERKKRAISAKSHIFRSGLTGFTQPILHVLILL